MTRTLGLRLGRALALAFACAAIVPGAAASAGRIDPALASAAPGDTLVVLVEFTDRGERDAADLARRLAAAETALTPRSRARRLRARVAPLVDERDLPVAPAYLDALRARGFAPLAVSRWLNRAAVRVAGADLGRLAASPAVGRVTSVPRVVRSADPPGDTGVVPVGRVAPRGELAAASDYGLLAAAVSQIGVPALHDSGYAGAGVLVCVTDEGFNRWDTHEALRNTAIAPGMTRDFVQGDTIVVDTTQTGLFTHGTWVLGCLAGNRPGTYVGTAPAASYALARTENSASELPVEMLNWGLAAEWADSLGADVIASSVAYGAFDVPAPAYTYASLDGRTTDISRYAEIAASKGMLVVNSVGNEGQHTWHWLLAPADVHGDSLVAVGAVDDLAQPAAFSSYGPTPDGRVKPDLAARGVAVPLPATTGGPAAYTTQNGTSFSAPLVAGLAACMLQARPAWTPRDVIRALRASASRSSSPDDRVGYGIPNGALALGWTPSGGLPVPGTAIVLGPSPIEPGGPGVRVRFVAAGVGTGANRGRVRVLDVAGRELATLWRGEIQRGQSVDVRWTGADDAGRRVRSGIYFLALDAGGDVVAARVVVLD